MAKSRKCASPGSPASLFLASKRSRFVMALLATTGRLHRRSLPACPLDLRLRLLCVSSIAPEVRYALALSRIAAASCRVFASRSEEHTSELQSRLHLVCRLLLEKKKKQ